jgi:hypothetical protein
VFPEVGTEFPSGARKRGAKDTSSGSMRPTVIIILAVLIGALLAFDTFEYDGHYRGAIWEQTKYQAGEIEHTVENWLGNFHH